DLSADECESQPDRGPRWPGASQEPVPENPQQHAAGGPGRESSEPECSANAIPPERIEGMENQPVDWNRQFKEENKSGNRAQETHSTSFLIIFLEPCVRRRVADQAQNHQHTSQREPSPLRPALARA